MLRSPSIAGEWLLGTIVIGIANRLESPGRLWTVYGTARAANCAALPGSGRVERGRLSPPVPAPDADLLDRPEALQCADPTGGQVVGDVRNAFVHHPCAKGRPTWPNFDLRYPQVIYASDGGLADRSRVDAARGADVSGATVAQPQAV
jgi:hypothetical protein